MSQIPSPYTLPDPAPPQPTGATRNTVLIVAIVSMTLLLMCGGVVGLGIYAVDRLAEEMGGFADEGEWSDQDYEVALQFALEEDKTIEDKVGQIKEVTSQDELTYDFAADSEDYYYDVKGSKGDAIVVVAFDEDDEHRWFKSVELLEGSSVNSPRVPLQDRNAPFDSQWSKQVYDALAAGDHAVEKSLSIGEVTWITYDYENSLDSGFSTPELLFEIQGTTGTQSVTVEFDDASYEVIQSIYLVDEDGNKGQRIYSSDTTTTAQSKVTNDSNASETVSP